MSARITECRNTAGWVTLVCFRSSSVLLAHREREDDRVQEYGGLGDLGLLQVVLGAFKHEVGDAETQHLIGFLKQFFGLGIVVIQVLAHTDELCALTGEYECFHF